MESVDFTLTYDPALLNISGVTPGRRFLLELSVEGDLSVPGQVTVSLAVGNGSRGRAG